MEDLLRLRQMPAGAELLSGLRLAGRICRRLPVALRQRARPRQHPEGRHLFGRAAHVGRRDHRRRSCAPSPTWSTNSTIPTVKVTGGQRIDMLGIRKEDLPAVWADLGKAGFVSGHAYAKGAAHGEDLRRHRLVPLRHAGFDRARHPHREVHVGLVDAGQGQDGGLRLPAQLRRGDLQGCRRGLRRLRLRDPFRRRRRPRHQGHRGARPGEDRGRGAGGHRGADPDVSRAGRAISSASTNGPSASASPRSGARSSTMPSGARPSSTASSSARNSPRSTPGRSASPARTSTSSGRWRRSASRRRRSDASMNWIDIGTIDDIPRRGARCVRHAARQDRASSAPPTTGLRHRGPLPAQGRPAQPGHRPWRRGDLPAAQLGDLAGNRQGAGRRRRCGAGRSRCRVEGGRISIALGERCWRAE